MFKLLRNYIREQKNNLLQVLGLGVLVIIMVTTFLSLNFATSYLTDQYNNDIAHNEFHQDIWSNLLENNSQFKNWTFNDDSGNWFENMDYYYKDGNINERKLANATFQITKLPEYDEANNLYLYRFTYNNPSDNIAVGREFAVTTNHNYVDFKLSLPFNYPSISQHNTYLKQLADTINQYVYDAAPDNKTNFFITSQAALNYYNSNIKNKPNYSYAIRDYVYQDIINESKLYQALIIGMLYGDNITWKRASIENDIIMTGKILTFIQTTTKDVIGAPILVKDGGESLASKPLQDGEILIYQDFAKENNLHLGDTYIFAGHKFVIRGFATSTLAAAKGNYFPASRIDTKNQTVAFATQNTFEQITNDPYTKVIYSNISLYNPEVASKNIAPTINNYWLYTYCHQLFETKYHNNTLVGRVTRLSNSIDNKIFMEPLDYDTNNYRVIEQYSLDQLQLLKDIFNQISSVFLTLIFVVTTVIIFIIIFKMIDRNKQLIGILKANGYQSWKLNIALILSIITPLIVFALLGTAISVLVSKVIISAFSTTFAIVAVNFSFYFLPSILVIILPVLMLFGISFLIVAYLLRTPPLTLIKNSWSKNKYNLSTGVFFTFLTTTLIKRFSYRNKLVITNTIRSLGKFSIVVVVSIFASTLILFSLASNGLINNMLGLQFASINYSYGSQYEFNNGSINSNFISADKELLYKKETVTDIRSHPSLYEPIRQAVIDMINHPEGHSVVDCRYGYVMGSELLKIRRDVVEPALIDPTTPQEFKDFWNKNIYFINYLTNDNDKSDTDLMINFGLLAYNTLENPYTQLNFGDGHDFNIDDINTTHTTYDNNTNTLVGDWDHVYGAWRQVYGVNQDTSSYLRPGFRNTNFNDFSTLSLENMTNSNWWLNQNFINVRNNLISKLNINNPDTASVQIVPMVGSTAPGRKSFQNGDGNSLNKTVIYRYIGLDQQTKYVIGVVYDGANNLLPDTILMPQTWLNQVILGNSNSSLVSSFATAKFTNLKSNELHNYLPIISSKNDYLLDLQQIVNSNYLQDKGVSPGLSLVYDVNAVKTMIIAQQYTFQALLSFFGVFCVLLTFMIVVIISNINLRDNLILINILKSLGYSFFEISYIFLVVALPMLIICGVLSIYIAPFLTGVLATTLGSFSNLYIPVFFAWWYFAVSFLVVVVIYLLSYLITWKLNVSHKHLMWLTK